MGLDVESAIGSGLLRIVHHPDIELDSDYVAWEVWMEAERMGVRRVVIDDVDRLERGLSAERLAGLISAVAGHLSSQGLAVCLTRDACNVDGGGFSCLPLPAVADNVIALRLVERGDEICRQLAVVKMRSSDHSHCLRTYTIDDNGVRFCARARGDPERLPDNTSDP
jgi:KaiC/GvpD/RAD55 family RecA-like ATPase